MTYSPELFRVELEYRRGSSGRTILEVVEAIRALGVEVTFAAGDQILFPRGPYAPQDYETPWTVIR